MQLCHPHGCDLSAAHLNGELTHKDADRSCAVASIVPQAHRRGACMVGLPHDGQLLPGNPLQVAYRTNGDALNIKNRALFNV